MPRVTAAPLPMIHRTCRAAVAASLLAAPAAAQSFSYPDFSSTTGLSLVERAATVGNILRVHDAVATGGGNRGAVWYLNPVNVAAGFDTTFVFNINSASSTGGGDGMAFVIQNEMIPGDTGGVGVNGIGRHASALGYGLFSGSAPGESIDNSLVIEIDNFTNGGAIADPDNNHISVHTGGNGENDQSEDFSIGRADNATLGTDTNDGTDHTIRVRYSPGTLEVYYDGALVIQTAYDFSTGSTWIDSNQPVGGLDLNGGTSAYVGFTASSGGVLENHDLVSWTFDGGAISTNFCTALPNSTGNPAGISGQGTTSVAANDVTLVASDVPPFQFGIFLNSEMRGPGTPVASGNLCLTGAIGRYFGPGQILQADPTGSFSLQLDLTQTPTPTQLVSIAPGETWYFQAWYRDTGPACPTANFTDGIEVLFTN